ncbi:general stress protein [Microbacterium sp. CFBP9023]|uniref:general stress protein n=1 Tax=Microbacterium sp. CFBP9023 TaxID=3096535 RepID=UPI002A69CEAE|nr:general stress protein [Microbacterium sp. CFBP9023]MDY0982279.1 general stress protein [Microbacterium sp. CFBP9023]
MSMLNRPADSRDEGEIVASTRDYEGAQKTVSKLIAQEVPARDIAIIGQSVRTVERITGRLGYAAAARSGAINGVLIGLFLSAILVIGNPEVPIQLFVGFVFIGVALGMLLSLVTYAIVRRRRDFASVTQFAADHYEVRVQAASLAKARLALGAATPAPARAPVNLDEPPRYGERITPGAHEPAGQPTTTTQPTPEEPTPEADPTPGSEPTPPLGGGETPPAEPAVPPRPADPEPPSPAAPGTGGAGVPPKSAEPA